MATFTYQKNELLKYYEKSDSIFNKHQKMFGELIGKLNSNKSLVKEMTSNIDDFMKKSFDNFNNYCDKIYSNQLDATSVFYIFDLNKKDFLDKDSFPLDDKYIIRENNFQLKLSSCQTTTDNTWNVNNIKLNQTQISMINNQYQNYVFSKSACSFSGQKYQITVQPRNNDCYLSIAKSIDLNFIIDNYFNIYVPELHTYFVSNYTAFPLYSFYINENKLNLYHDTLSSNKRVIMYNQLNTDESKEFNEIQKFVSGYSSYHSSVDQRNLYKTEYYKYLINFYDYDKKLQYFEQFLQLSENFSTIMPIHSLSLTDNTNTTSLVEEEQKIFLQSNRIQELNLKLKKQEEELQYLRQERNQFIKTIGDKDIELVSRNKLINELNDNLRSKISEYGKVERENILLKTKLLKVDELDSKNRKIQDDLNILNDDLQIKNQKITEQEIVNQTLMDKQLELSSKLDLCNKEKQDLTYKTTEHHLVVKRMEDEMANLALKCKTREKEIVLTQNRLDTVIQQLKRDEEENVTKNGQYQQILLKQIKEKSNLLESAYNKINFTEAEYDKIKKEYTGYKSRVARLVGQ